MLEESISSYAVVSNKSRGRVYSDETIQYRNEYQRDRDRIVHSSAFRRLEYKTQVFASPEGDMFRTRLTHSIEVAQISRTIARALNLNEDLTEAISLAHDLGHTPFGHAGQDALNECMSDYGGFEHNFQSLRIVDLLEMRYGRFPGLNLMFETREGILKHCSRKNAIKLGELGERFLNKQKPSLEAQLVNIADEIAYNNHDIDDGLRSGLLTIEQLKECELAYISYQMVVSKWNDLKASQIRNEVIRRMINYEVSDLIKTSDFLIEKAKPQSVDDVRRSSKNLICMSDATNKMHLALKKFLRKELYQHKHVKENAVKAKKIIYDLFYVYMDRHELLTKEVQNKIKEYNKLKNKKDSVRVIADYIAGMTDRFALSEHERVFGKTIDNKF